MHAAIKILEPPTENLRAVFIHSFSNLSYDRSKASSKASSPRSAI
jgi:hypothetical protein